MRRLRWLRRPGLRRWRELSTLGVAYLREDIRTCE